ncbi:hypothetical protein [Desulfosporosinus sp. FKA]|uniref:hypothetical protein n=1 Tax=Desulfosporosinus sp. FKA TaxID=1969834 RepID=UPI000B49C29F|nr:hypothetical protein [Desulfosporosinus sp. FKA]
MTRKQFALKNGFSTYHEMQTSSRVVFQETSSWLVTLTEYGFLAWIDTSFEKPLGYFDSFELAKQEIFDAVNQTLNATEIRAELD